MLEYQEIEGDLIKLAKEGYFEVIAHGCNCQCVMGAGLAPQMASFSGCNKYFLENKEYKGDIDKLGRICYGTTYVKEGEIARAYLVNKTNQLLEKEGFKKVFVVNCYTQYMYGTNHLDGVSKPLDYEALILCLRKMNHIFKGKHIGLPQIGCHLAGGDWNVVKEIIKKELKDCKVTIVIYKPN